MLVTTKMSWELSNHSNVQVLNKLYFEEVYKKVCAGREPTRNARYHHVDRKTNKPQCNKTRNKILFNSESRVANGWWLTMQALWLAVISLEKTPENNNFIKELVWLLVGYREASHIAPGFMISHDEWLITIFEEPCSVYRWEQLKCAVTTSWNLVIKLFDVGFLWFPITPCHDQTSNMLYRQATYVADSKHDSCSPVC